VAAEETLAAAVRHFRRLDVLVNNAAICPIQPFDSLSLEGWRAVIDTNLTAYFLCAQMASREMRRAGGGSIINIGSIHRMISEPGAVPYAASKAAVGQLTRSLALELAPYDIVVNSITPGFIRTPMSVTLGVDETTTPRFVTNYLESGRIPLRRAGIPEDVAIAALFLATRECGYLTGGDIVVDGGLSITL
jgi:NAD(P)-dependent dehydrogenase (short-subunit alcohol dehydrogenase family)